MKPLQRTLAAGLAGAFLALTLASCGMEEPTAPELQKAKEAYEAALANKTTATQQLTTAANTLSTDQAALTALKASQAEAEATLTQAVQDKADGEAAYQRSQEAVIKAEAKLEKLQREQQREPTVEQIARELGIRREEVVFAMDAVCDPVSLFEPIYSDGGDAVCVMDQVRDTKNTDEDWLEQIALKEAMARLSERERQILALRYSDGKTQMEVSSEIGISQAQVSRLEKNAIKSIKKNM